MKEFWVEVDGFEDYMISSFGRIRNWKTGEELNPWLRRNPVRFQVVLRRGNIAYPQLVHILVAKSFYNYTWNDDFTIEHADGDRKNVRVENLIVVPRNGVDENTSKEGGVRIVETGEVFDTQKECAQRIGGFASAISDCLRGRRRSHKGYTFEWADK